jgi:DNA-binding NarL/FixJ family response regulator
MPITLLVVDDHDLFRDGLRVLIEQESRYSLLAEARNGREATQLAGQLMPDIILMDLYMPILDGLEATGCIHSEHPRCQIIGLSSCTDQRTIRRLLAAGAAAYVSKSWPFRELCRAINAVHARQPYLIPASRTVPFTGEPGRRHAGQLSPREQQTLQLIAQGKSSQDIANLLCVCLKTVEAHRHNLRQKLGLNGVAELTRYVLQEHATATDAL